MKAATSSETAESPQTADGQKEEDNTGGYDTCYADGFFVWDNDTAARADSGDAQGAGSNPDLLTYPPSSDVRFLPLSTLI